MKTIKLFSKVKWLVVTCLMLLTISPQIWGTDVHYILVSKGYAPLTKKTLDASYNVLKTDGSSIGKVTSISSSITSEASLYYNSTSPTYSNLTSTSNYGTSSGDNNTLRGINITSGSTMTISLGSQTFTKIDVIYRCNSSSAGTLTVAGEAVATKSTSVGCKSKTGTFSTSITISATSQAYRVVVILTREYSPSYTVTYDANGGSGSVPTDANTYELDDPVTVLGKSTLSKSGYIFTGWNTKANGTGTPYMPGETMYTGAENATLYAQWDTELDLKYVWKTGNKFCDDNSTSTTTVNMISDNDYFTLTGTGVSQESGSSLNIGKAVGNYFLITAKSGYQISSICFYGKIESTNVNKTTDNSDWSGTIASTGTSSDKRYTFDDINSTYFGVKLNTADKGIWIRNMVITIASVASSCSAPTTTFGNGEYTVGGSALDLSTLIGSNNSSGAITYTVKNANGTGASISTASFTATTAGTCTVTATQAANGDKCEKVMDATITVNATPSISSFSPASGSTIKSGTTITVSGSSSSTVYCLWASSTPSASDVKGGTAGTSGAAAVTSAGIASANGTTLYAVATRGGATSSISSASYTIDDTAPTLSSSNPANGATGVATSGTIVLTFSEAIANVDGSKFTLTGATKGAVAKDGSNNTKVNIAYSGAANSATVTLATTAGAVSDAAGNTCAALSDISFTTVAETPTLTALVAGTLYEVPDMIPSGASLTSDDQFFEGLSANTKFELIGSASSSTTPKVNNNSSNDRTIDGITFDDGSMWFKGEASLTNNIPTTFGLSFIVPGTGKLYLYFDNDDTSTNIKLAKSGATGAKPTVSSGYAVVDVTEGTYYMYGTGTTSPYSFYGLKFVTTYAITLHDNNGGEHNGSAKVEANGKTLLDISAPTRTGYDVEGYYGEAGCTNKVADASGNLQASVTISETAYTNSSKEWIKGSGATLYAKWTPNQYSVSHSLSNVTKNSGATGANAATYGTNYTAEFAAAGGFALPSTITVTIGGETATSGTEYTWNQASGTVTIGGSYITGDIVITVSGTADCPSSGSGATVYKFVVSGDVGTGSVCAATSTNTPLTVANGKLSTMTGGTLTAYTTNTSNLKYATDAISWQNGTAGQLILNLDCALATGDIIRFVNYSSSNGKYNYLRHTSNSTTTDQITLNASTTAGTVQEIVVPSAFNNKEELYIVAGSNTTGISYFEIIRPYVVTLDANTNGGKVGGEDTKTMYFVADESQLLPRATKSDYLFKGWFNASSGGYAVANPYTAAESTTLYAQFGDCPEEGTVYKFQLKTELTNGSIAAGDLNEGNYLSAMDGGTAVITGSHAQIVNNNAIDFKDNGDYITVNLDCELKAGDYFKTTISGSKSGIKVTTTGSTTSLQDISYGTNVETEVPASLVGSKTFRIYRQDSNCGGLSYFEIVRPAGSEVTYNNGGHGEAPSSTTAAAVTLADISVTGWKNTGWKADVDVKVSGSTVSAGTEIAVGTVVTILETTTFTAQWVDCCFEFAGGTKDSGWPVAIDGSITTSLYKTSTGAVLTGGTVVNSGTATIGSNDGVKGLVFDAEGNNAITITLSGSHAFGVGTVITISGASGDKNSSSNNFGFSVNGNNLETTSLSTANASFEKSYTVAALDGVEGGKTIQIKLNTSCLRKTYLKSVTVTGCADCTPIDPTLTYSKTTIWMDDADLTATPTLSGYYGTPTISYTSSDPTVVRVDNSSTGAITALKRGTATITATIGETTVSTTDYCGNTADCEITVKDISCGEVVLASATRKSGSGSVMENGTGAYYSASGINSETSGKLGSNGHYMYITLTGTTLQDGDVVVINLNTVGGIGDLAIHLFAGTTSGSTEIGTKASPGTGDNEITLSNVPNNTYSVTMYRTSDNQNHKVDGIKVKRYVCPDSKEFLPTASSGNWNATDNWIGSDGRGASLPTISDRVVVSKPVTVDIEHAVAKSVTIYNNGSDKTGKLTIQPNKGLEVTGLVQKTTDGSSYTCTSEADLILESSSAGNASLVFDNSNSNHATVVLYSKASVEGKTWNWQYIGTALSDANALYDYYGSYLYKWSGGWTAVANGADMEAFAGYCIANKTANTTYITEGTLVPTTSHSVDIAAGKDMVLANSWTAPISIASFTNTTFTSTPATVYLFNTGSAVNGSSAGSEAGTYIAVPIASAPYTENGLIAPQQGFFVTAKNGTAGTITMNYSELVRPAGSHTDIVAGQMKSPVRRDMPLADYDPNVMKIKVSGSVYTDRVIILERADFTEGFDNGWDGERKGMGKVSPSIYVINAEGKKDAVSAIPDYEGTLVGFKAGSGDTEYVMTFNYDGDDILYLNDLKEETSTQISEGNTYTFTTESDDSDARFVISATPFIKTTPTGLDDAEWNGNGVRKVIHNDHMYIIRGGCVFDAVGGLVK